MWKILSLIILISSPSYGRDSSLPRASYDKTDRNHFLMNPLSYHDEKPKTTQSGFYWRPSPKAGLGDPRGMTATGPPARVTEVTRSFSPLNRLRSGWSLGRRGKGRMVLANLSFERRQFIGGLKTWRCGLSCLGNAHRRFARGHHRHSGPKRSARLFPSAHGRPAGIARAGVARQADRQGI